MSILSDAQIGHVCRKAGFVGPGLVTAIGTALAASGGVPSYTHPVWPGPVAHYRGLWGLDTVERPEYADMALDNPYTAARVAYELTKRGDFGWCPVWRAGTDRWYAPRARAAAADLPYAEIQVSPISIATLRRRTLRDADRLGQTINTVTRMRFGG